MQALRELAVMTASSLWPIFWPTDHHQADAAAVAMAKQMADALARNGASRVPGE